MAGEGASMTVVGSAVEAHRGWSHGCVDGADKSTWVNSVRVDRYGPSELPALVSSYLECGRSHVVHFLPAHPMVLAEQDESYRDVLNRGDLNLIDGASVALAVLLQGQLCARTTGSDALAMLPEWGLTSDVGHYLYGSTPDVVEKLRGRLEDEHPGIRIAGAESPPFRELTDDELEDAATRIREQGTDLLWIGLGTPKQDLVADRLRALNAAPVILCVGAAFDFAAGTTRRAPAWMRSIGLEWAFRLVIEPRRLWRRYLIGNARFIAQTVSDRTGARNGSRSPADR